MTDRPLPAPIAIDGPAASGKSTLGEALARRFGYRFLDTGMMYRAFTLAALREGVPAEEQACETLLLRLKLHLRSNGQTRVFLAEEDVTPRLRDDDVEANVSAYSALPVVRAAMVFEQQRFAAMGPAVLAGRDIGTVVLPHAPIKFYLKASESARARRRSAQAKDWGRDQHHDDAHRDITGRDQVDSRRATSPLKPADDAIEIDTTHMTLEQVIEFAVERVQCFAD